MQLSRFVGVAPGGGRLRGGIGRSRLRPRSRARRAATATTSPAAISPFRWTRAGAHPGRSRSRSAAIAPRSAKRRIAIVALAGGPGQSAIPFAEQFARVLGPIAATRDLIVFDQRGIGLSEPLSCHRFELDANTPPGPTIAECAAQLGPTRSFYATADTVADIEALRVAGRLRKARAVRDLLRHEGRRGLRAGRIRATSRRWCSTRSCPPTAPNRSIARRSRRSPASCASCAPRAPARASPPTPSATSRDSCGDWRAERLRGRVIDGRGIAHTVRISSDGLLGTLIEGDLEPILRSEFPAAVRSAVNGDTAPLARLEARAESWRRQAKRKAPSESFDNPLYYATSCEDEPFPWNRASSPATRLAEAKARIAALPASQLAPFTAANVLDLSDMPACAFWPYTAPAPAPNRGAIAERPDADPERRRRSAHADLERTRSRGADPRIAPAGGAEHRTLGAQLRPHPLRERRPPSPVRGQADQALCGHAATADPAPDAAGAEKPGGPRPGARAATDCPDARCRR